MGIRSQGYAGLPGRGPWMILADCPAASHNTVYSAEGRRGKPRCICPRALVLRQERIDKRRGEYKSGTVLRRNCGRPQPVAETLTRPIIGACRTRLDVVDAAIKSSRGHAAMRALCATCPVQPRCRDWVLKAEEPAGSWSGVLGGLDPLQRRNIREAV